MATVKRCPRCRLVNPDNGLRCDCGYDFEAQEIKGSLLSENERRVSMNTRFFTMLIDSLLCLIPIYVFAVIQGSRPSNWWFLAITFAYYFLFELATQRIPGKIMMKTRVVAADGGTPTAGAILLRTLIRFVPFEPLSGLFAGRLWHDTWSDTRVIISV